MAKVDARLVLYSVDLQELREWIGCKDEARFQAAWDVIREDEDSEWEPEELVVLERLLRRLIFEGKLYDRLAAEEHYYLTQLLIDLFDEYVDQEALSDDIPLDRLMSEVEALPHDGEAYRLCSFLVRGRQLGGDRLIWGGGPVEDVLSYLGYLSSEECGRLAKALEEGPRRPAGRPSALVKQIRTAAEECARAELDLLSFIG